MTSNIGKRIIVAAIFCILLNCSATQEVLNTNNDITTTYALIFTTTKSITYTPSKEMIRTELPTATNTKKPRPTRTSEPTEIVFQPTFTSTNRQLLENDYEVYSVIINTDDDGYFGTGLILISNQTETEKGFSEPAYETYKFILETFQDIDQETFGDYAAINNMSYKLTRRFSILSEYILVASNGDAQSIIDSYKKASGLIVFSRIGFNSNRDQALLNVLVYCGHLCGEIKYYLLEKVGSEWVIIQSEVFMRA